MKTVYRPSHADYTNQTKYGIRDPRGGGRSSARETIASSMKKAITKLEQIKNDINKKAYTSKEGQIKIEGRKKD